ncbi:MAG: hypothetical protein EOO81_09630 [Oxalobacteraceae bacterium]|nr:MAG: hypothetical protein EOO81_09630 [Oxalobacteraceae bacterium]
MPNGNAPTGLNPVRDLYGTPYNGSVNHYAVPASDANALYIGDPVKLLGTSSTINSQSMADVGLAATTDVIVGVVIGFVAGDRDAGLFRGASTQRIAIVCDNPNAMFEIQDIGTGTPLTIADIGLNVSFTTVAAGGSTFTGLSGVVLDNTTEATTNTLALKIVGFPNRPDNDAANAEANKKLYVRINRHQYANQVAGV